MLRAECVEGRHVEDVSCVLRRERVGGLVRGIIGPLRVCEIAHGRKGRSKGKKKEKERKVKGECRVIEEGRIRQGDGVGSGQRC